MPLNWKRLFLASYLTVIFCLLEMAIFTYGKNRFILSCFIAALVAMFMVTRVTMYGWCRWWKECFLHHKLLIDEHCFLVVGLILVAAGLIEWGWPMYAGW